MIIRLRINSNRIGKMGTRSITHVHEMKSLGEDKIVCSFYRHFDGYPTGHGKDLADWLKGKRLVNGIGSDFKADRDHNRAGQMAIELMHSLKQETSIECLPTGVSDYGEEFVYHVYFDNEFLIECIPSYSGKTFKGKAADFDGEKIESELYEE